MKFQKLLKHLCTSAWFALVLSLSATPAVALDSTELRQLMQLAEYIGVDYIEAVDDGEVINSDEYQEMEEFSQLILDRAEGIEEPSAQAILAAADRLVSAIQDKQDLPNIQSLTNELRRLLLEISPGLSLPRELTEPAIVQELFSTLCVSCHGENGQGDGLLAENLNPPPTDFTDHERAMSRSILGLYDAISNGIDGTAMTPYPQLSDQQRWSLAFYLGRLAFNDTENDVQPSIGLEQWINYSPNALLAQHPSLDANDINAHRSQPELFFQAPSNPLQISRSRLQASQSAYHQGNLDSAHKLAVSAYLDGFELVENSLDARSVELRREIEASLMGFRQVVSKPENGSRVDDALTQALEQLQRAEQLLSEESLSSSTLFSVSLVILLREGLEALLVIIALVAVLIRTERKDAVAYVHAGWIIALVAGAGTWIAAQTLINISGASREIMEGVAALLAAVVLFYVGFWMHSKTNAVQWQAYIKRSIDHNLKTGTLWGIAGLSFVAVYREVFETVLFYQSLLTQAETSQLSVVFGGFIAGVILLAIIAWIMIRYSFRLPIGRFFSITTYLLLVLSFILMGKAVTALQEAALISATPLPWRIEFDWLGIHSTWQSLSAQLLVLLLSGFMLLQTRMQTDSAEAAQ
ncbi:cytochrome c/FTR1 family iron permease [Aurantivibrio infirmus]